MHFLRILVAGALLSRACTQGYIMTSANIYPTAEVEDVFSRFEQGVPDAVEPVNAELARFHAGTVAMTSAETTLQTPSSTLANLEYAAVEAAFARAPLVPAFKVDVEAPKSLRGNFMDAADKSPLPVAPYRSLQMALPISWRDTFTITRSNQLGMITVPQSYLLQFDVFPLPQADDSWRNIVHFTQGGDSGLGNRLPGVWFCHVSAGCVDKGAMLVHYQGTPNGAAIGFLTRQTIPQSEWTTIRIIIDTNANYMGFEASGAWGSFKQGASFPGQSNLVRFEFFSSIRPPALSLLLLF